MPVPASQNVCDLPGMGRLRLRCRLPDKAPTFLARAGTDPVSMPSSRHPSDQAITVRGSGGDEVVQPDKIPPNVVERLRRLRERAGAIDVFAAHGGRFIADEKILDADDSDHRCEACDLRR